MLVTTLNITSIKLQKTERVRCKVGAKEEKHSIKNHYIYFEGESLIGYIFLTPELIRQIKSLPEE